MTMSDLDEDDKDLPDSPSPEQTDGISRRDVLQLGCAVAGGSACASLGLHGVDQAAAQAADAVATGAPPPLPVRITINGASMSLDVDPRPSLLDLLRERLDLTGTKKGCNQGACGACTILVDGKRVNSCLTLAVMHDGAQVTTIEGVATGEDLHPLQTAFIEHDGFQCGYCTPGQIMSAIGCIAEGHADSPGEIRAWMSGNICRCGVYPASSRPSSTRRVGWNGSDEMDACAGRPVGSWRDFGAEISVWADFALAKSGQPGEQPILSPVRQRRRFVRPVVNSYAGHISIHPP
ncbi:MAG: hypothetical protein K0R61_1638 [Microvirga sp.]|nr:hypothetical protein [Microvirga sp.]